MEPAEQPRATPPLTQDLKDDFSDAFLATVHSPRAVETHRGYRGAEIFWALPERSRTYLETYGNLCRVLQENPRLMDDLLVDYVVARVPSDGGAPPPPAGAAPRTHRNLTIFFSLRESE